MILTCPSCGTQYVVKDGAIPPQGRQVRCASCKHSWHQDPERGPPGHDELDPSEQEQVAGTGSDEERPALESTGQEEDAWVGDDPVEARSESQQAVQAEETIEQELATDGNVAIEGEQIWQHDMDDQVEYDFSPFAEREPLEPRRRTALVPILLGLLTIAAIAAAVWFLAPQSLKQRLGIASAETPLQLMMTHSDRQKLASGNELLSVSGRVINPTAEAQPVPPIRAELRTSKGALVHSWTISPPASVLPPNTSKPFNSAEMSVPAGGEVVTISLEATRV